MINVFCYYFGVGGWASYAKGFVSALNRYEDVALVSWTQPQHEYELSPEVEVMLENGGKLTEKNAGIGIGPMEIMPGIIGRSKIAYTFWETTRIPGEKLDCLQNADMVWVPSTWGKTVLVENGVDEKKLR